MYTSAPGLRRFARSFRYENTTRSKTGDNNITLRGRKCPYTMLFFFFQPKRTSVYCTDTILSYINAVRESTPERNYTIHRLLLFDADTANIFLLKLHFLFILEVQSTAPNESHNLRLDACRSPAIRGVVRNKYQRLEP